MPQNRDTGDAARQFGLKCGKLVAEKIGAVPVGGRSNEAVYDGERIVVKCARRANRTVGVLVTMLKTVQQVLGAFEVSPGKFEMWFLDGEKYRELMTHKSQRPKAAAQGMVTYSKFREHGRFAGTINLEIGD